MLLGNRPCKPSEPAGGPSNRVLKPVLSKPTVATLERAFVKAIETYITSHSPPQILYLPPLLPPSRDLCAISRL